MPQLHPTTGAVQASSARLPQGRRREEKPEDAELVLWAEAREWAELEISRKGPSSDPLMDQLIWDSEIARLAHERMEELLEQSR